MNLILLQQAIDYIETIPDNVFNLEALITQGGSCGTIACAAGHLAMSPDFQALGLTLVPNCDGDGWSGGRLRWQGLDHWWDTALGELFDLDRMTAGNLFGQRGDGSDDEYQFEGTDKQLWLQRARTFIAEQQVPA